MKNFTTKCSTQKSHFLNLLSIIFKFLQIIKSSEYNIHDRKPPSTFLFVVVINALILSFVSEATILCYYCNEFFMLKQTQCQHPLQTRQKKKNWENFPTFASIFEKVNSLFFLI